MDATAIERVIRAQAGIHSSTILGWTIFAFLCGSLPIAVWLGRYALKTDITQFGDGNPGATNVYRATKSVPWYALALALEFSKAAVPVGLAYQIFGVQDWRIIPVALATTLGHMFSPFLRGRGGKALATVGGVWIAIHFLTLFLPLMVLTVLWSLVVKPSGWAVALTLASFILYIVLRDFSTVILWLILAQTPLILARQLPELRHRPTLAWRS